RMATPQSPCPLRGHAWPSPSFTKARGNRSLSAGREPMRHGEHLPGNQQVPTDALLETARMVSFDAMVMASDVIMVEMRSEAHVKQHVRGLLLTRLCDVTRNTSSFRAG